MQVLYLWDSNGEQNLELGRQALVDAPEADDESRRAAIDMASATWDQRETIDPWIERLAPQWPPRRQPLVDRNLIRLAVWELTNAHAPPKVVIDEAIELAKQFSTEHSPAFINGVLDAVLKEHQAMTGFGVQGSGVSEEKSSSDPGS